MLFGLLISILSPRARQIAESPPGCRGVLDLRYNSTSRSDPQALFQVAQFERLLRSALAMELLLLGSL
jgi:hypothetical protein